jgi:RimJ/RimL family protein N-acetyltransferase
MTSGSQIELREITMANFRECIRLSVADDQRRGYGRSAMSEVIGRLRSTPGCRRIRTSFEPNNKVADALYYSLGFRKTGEVDEGETVTVLDWIDA